MKDRIIFKGKAANDMLAALMGAEPPLSQAPSLADIETALVNINSAEGYLIVGNVAHGMRMLAKGKSILERLVSANDELKNAESKASGCKESVQ